MISYCVLLHKKLSALRYVTQMPAFREPDEAKTVQEGHIPEEIAANLEKMLDA